VWTWGDNDYGQLGDGTLASRSTPGQVSGIDVPNVRGISAGNGFSMVLGSDGSVWGWGADYDSQLGNANTDTRWVGPVETIGMDRSHPGVRRVPIQPGGAQCSRFSLNNHDV
jgi:alpha-tubulin suppressor-like RCC1 family protein